MGKPFPGPFSFLHHPWAREMHDSDADSNIGMKAAQMAFTETALNRTFYKIDIEGVDCLYVLPARSPDASDFSSARFDSALELSPHLATLFSDVKNIGHKRAGSRNLYIRGARSRSGLKSVPAGFLVFDELDEMDQDNVQLALERASGQEEKQIWKISTPTIDNFGIHKAFKASTQEFFAFKCPHCSRYTDLIFPDCLVITGDDINSPTIKASFLQCKECKHQLNHDSKVEWLANGKWVPTFSDRVERGFGINQLYSMTVSPREIAIAYLKSLSDPTVEQELYNSKFGLPHIVEGARVTDLLLENCVGTHKNGGLAPSYIYFTTIGIDVGKWLHYEVDGWILKGSVAGDININANCFVLETNKVTDFEQLDNVLYKYKPKMTVIDANPERRKAMEFANRFFGHVKLCYYGRSINGKFIHEKPGDLEIEVDRTAWLDLSLGRFHKGQKAINLPTDTTVEYKNHMKALCRVYMKDDNGNPIGRYEKGDDEDHYAHARNYSEMALALAGGVVGSQDIPA